MAEVPHVHRPDIVSGLREAGLSSGDTALVHSSLSSFGDVVGGAACVVDALLDAVGPEGTVAVPTHTWGTVNAGSPVFDVRQSESIVGRISEVFRCRPKARRGLHPTHSCAAIGPRARKLIRAHETDITPCGRHSPYQRLMARDGKIVFLGTGLYCNTTLHAVEELAVVPYLFDRVEDLYVLDYDGNRRHVPTLRHTPGMRRAFAKIGAPMQAEGIMQVSHVGNAEIDVVAARSMRDWLLPQMARDPFMLLQEQIAQKERKQFEKLRRRRARWTK